MEVGVYAEQLLTQHVRRAGLNALPERRGRGDSCAREFHPDCAVPRDRIISMENEGAEVEGQNNE